MATIDPSAPEPEAHMTDLAVTPLFGTRRTRLRPLRPEFVDHLFDLASTQAIDWPWHTGAETPESFSAGLWRDVLMQSAIEDVRSGQQVGLLTAFRANLFHGYAYMSAIVLPGFRLRMWPLEAGLIFVHNLFVKFNLRHVYAEVPEAGFRTIQSGAGSLFEVEGRLRGRLVVDSTIQDQFIISISRDRWLERWLPLVARCVMGPPAAGAHPTRNGHAAAPSGAGRS
jgi:hypothetical protein